MPLPVLPYVMMWMWIHVRACEFQISNSLRRSVEEIHDDGTPTTKTFEHVQSEIGAEEAEEVIDNSNVISYYTQCRFIRDSL